MLYEKIKTELQKVIVGQEAMIDGLIIALFSGGHLLLEGLPGLAKTTAINTLAKALGVDFKRVQFTPDLLPSDIVGSEVFNPKTLEFSINPGPILTNLLLADEINRAPAKVQSALLEAMQERQITIAKKTIPLPEPFFVMATQNPIEHEGTYPLPEAQLDRFMMKVVVGYNSFEEELAILNKKEQKISIKPVATAKDIKAIQKESENIHIEEALKRYIVSIITATRTHPDIMYGASPRGTIDLARASKTKAYIQQRDYVMPQDILEMAKPILRHRLILTYEAKAKRLDTDTLLDDILEKVPMP